MKKCVIYLESSLGIDLSTVGSFLNDIIIKNVNRFGDMGHQMMCFSTGNEKCLQYVKYIYINAKSKHSLEKIMLCI